MFDKIDGHQCLCFSLISICFSTVKILGAWEQEDFDATYKLKNTESYLMATELPRVVNLYG